MKKILPFILTLTFGILMVSCNVNDNPVFDDSEAFVAFDSGTMSVKESVGEISIPVTLASVQGLAVTISYEAVESPDSTVIPASSAAVAGKDFELLDAAGTLSFTSEARTQYVKIKIIEHKGTYTGDLKFQIRIKNSGSVKVSREDNIVVTITDNDHPLNAILGTYTCKGKSYFNGDVAWDMTFTKDPGDVSIVWIKGIAYGFAEGGGFYGTVTMKDNQPASIAIPIGQINTVNTTSSGDGNIYLFGLSSSVSLTDEGNIIVTVLNSGKNIQFDNEWGPAVNLGGTNSYYDLMYPGIEGTKSN